MEDTPMARLAKAERKIEELESELNRVKAWNRALESDLTRLRLVVTAQRYNIRTIEADPLPLFTSETQTAEGKE